MMLLLSAMARQEGFFALGSRPGKNHNPGDIEYGKFARAHGATGTDGRFAIFPDATTGYKAMAALLAGAYKGQTIHDAIYHYLGYSAQQGALNIPNPNEPGNYPLVYIAHVCEWTGLKPTDIISDHLEIPA